MKDSMPPGADLKRFLELVLEFRSYLVDGRCDANMQVIGRHLDEIIRVKGVLTEHTCHHLQL